MQRPQLASLIKSFGRRPAQLPQGSRKFSSGQSLCGPLQPSVTEVASYRIGATAMAITIEERGRLEAKDEAWGRAHPLPPSAPHVLDRIGTGIKYVVVEAVKIVALACVVVFFVLPYTLSALAVAGGAILALRVLNYCRGTASSTSTMVPGSTRGSD